MSVEARLREEICTVGASLYARGYTVGSAGNISARLEDGWLITPTDACLGRLDPAAIAKVGLEGDWVSGDKPSKDPGPASPGLRPQSRRGRRGAHPLHSPGGPDPGRRLVPGRHPATHHPLPGDEVGHIPLIPLCPPRRRQRAEQVAQLANRVRGVMLERLGPVVWESSVSKASFALEELEETARLWLLSEPRPAPLDAAALAELAETFGAVW